MPRIGSKSSCPTTVFSASKDWLWPLRVKANILMLFAGESPDDASWVGAACPAWTVWKLRAAARQHMSNTSPMDFTKWTPSKVLSLVRIDR
jgi:hypothetical protein